MGLCCVVTPHYDYYFVVAQNNVEMNDVVRSRLQGFSSFSTVNALKLPALVVIKFELLDGRCYIIPLIVVALASEWIGNAQQEDFKQDCIFGFNFWFSIIGSPSSSLKMRRTLHLGDVSNGTLNKMCARLNSLKVNNIHGRFLVDMPIRANMKNRMDLASQPLYQNEIPAYFKLKLTHGELPGLFYCNVPAVDEAKVVRSREVAEKVLLLTTDLATRVLQGAHEFIIAHRRTSSHLRLFSRLSRAPNMEIKELSKMAHSHSQSDSAEAIKFAKSWLIHDADFWRKAIFCSEITVSVTKWNELFVGKWRVTEDGFYEEDCMDPIKASVTVWGWMSSRGKGRCFILPKGQAVDGEFYKRNFLQDLKEEFGNYAVYIFHPPPSSLPTAGFAETIHPTYNVYTLPSFLEAINPMSTMWMKLGRRMRQVRWDPPAANESWLINDIIECWEYMPGEVVCSAMVDNFPAELKKYADGAIIEP